MSTGTVVSGKTQHKYWRFVRKHWRGLLTGLMIVSLLVLLERETANHVKRDNGDYGYAWGNNTLGVTVTLGACNDVQGQFFNMPTRPTTVQQLGDLIVTVPSTNRAADAAHVSVRAPNFYAILMASGLAHCVADDGRLMPRG